MQYHREVIYRGWLQRRSECKFYWGDCAFERDRKDSFVSSHTAFTSLNVYHLAAGNDGDLRPERALLQWQQWFLKGKVHPDGGFLFDFGQLCLDEETPQCAVSSHRQCLALLTVSGRPNLWTPVSTEGKFSALCAAQLSVWLWNKSCVEKDRNKQIKLLGINHRQCRCLKQVFQLFIKLMGSRNLAKTQISIVPDEIAININKSPRSALDSSTEPQTNKAIGRKIGCFNLWNTSIYVFPSQRVLVVSLVCVSRLYKEMTEFNTKRTVHQSLT